jgi:hypothetical protein
VGLKFAKLLGQRPGGDAIEKSGQLTKSFCFLQQVVNNKDLPATSNRSKCQFNWTANLLFIVGF